MAFALVFIVVIGVFLAAGELLGRLCCLLFGVNPDD